MRLHAVKLPHHKSSAEQATIKPDLPKQVAISLSQGGTPCTPLVQVGDEVLTGQIIGDSDAFVSAPVHSSVTGTITGLPEVLNIFGNKQHVLSLKPAKNNNYMNLQYFPRDSYTGGFYCGYKEKRF